MRQTKYTFTFKDGSKIVKFWSDGEKGLAEARILAQAEQVRSNRDFDVVDVQIEDTENTQVIKIGSEED